MLLNDGYKDRPQKGGLFCLLPFVWNHSNTIF